MIPDFAFRFESSNVTGSVEDLRDDASDIARRFERRGAVVELDGTGPTTPSPPLSFVFLSTRTGPSSHHDFRPVCAVSRGNLRLMHSSPEYPSCRTG